MQPIEMPVQLLTESSIWNSFRISGKKHLILTGSRHSGKSTLLKKLYPSGIPGITTWAVPYSGVFLRENGTDNQARIGLFDPTIPGDTNRMKPDPAGFAELGIPALERCEASESPFIMIDEIGYLDASCPEYCNAITQLLCKKQVIAAVRKQKLTFLSGLLSRDDVFVLDLDAPFGNTGCIIMASGMGTRFGGNKLMADFREKPLIAGCLEATAHIPNRVVVTRHPEVAGYCRDHSVPVILHALPYRSDTVRLGMEALGETACCIFCQGDQPLLRMQTVDAVLMAGIQKNAPILRAAFDGNPGSPILFPSRFYPELKSLPDGKGGNFVAKKHPEQVQFVPVQDEKELLDVDTPEDLKLLAGQ